MHAHAIPYFYGSNRYSLHGLRTAITTLTSEPPPFLLTAPHQSTPPARARRARRARTKPNRVRPRKANEMMPQLYLVDLDDGRLKHQKRRVDRGRRVGILLSLCVLLQRTYSAEVYK